MPALALAQSNIPFTDYNARLRQKQDDQHTAGWNEMIKAHDRIIFSAVIFEALRSISVSECVTCVIVSRLSPGPAVRRPMAGRGAILAARRKARLRMPTSSLGAPLLISDIYLFWTSPFAQFASCRLARALPCLLDDPVQDKDRNIERDVASSRQGNDHYQQAATLRSGGERLPRPDLDNRVPAGSRTR
jgi:hypothetical protein